MIKLISDPQSVPANVLDHPSMMSDGEKISLYHLAKDHFRGEGIIVDAGIFLGASTIAFASGIKDNTALGQLAHKPVHSFDIAIWVRSMQQKLHKPGYSEMFEGTPPEPGESFEPALRRIIGGHEDVVELFIGDIVKLARAEQRVEIAFYDCNKTYERDLACFQGFAPHYMPGHTIVIQQDYFYEQAHWLKVRQEFLSDYFSYIGQVGSSAYFLCEKPIPEEYFKADPVKRLSTLKQYKLVRQAAERAMSERHRILTELSGLRLLIDAGEGELAAQHWRRLRRDISAGEPGKRAIQDHRALKREIDQLVPAS